MQTIKLRQTTENNGGPCILKNDAKGVPWASKSELGMGTCWEFKNWISLINEMIQNGFLNQSTNSVKRSDSKEQFVPKWSFILLYLEVALYLDA